jgi:cysteinyl-tRNA synthetase
MKFPFYIYNTATRSKDLFEHDGTSPVGMYCCGPTVYNYAHIGNLRTYIFEDVLKRALLSQGYEVKHLINITDVGHLVSDEDTGEDKMEKGAAREGKTVWDIAAFYTKCFMDNIKDLNVLAPAMFPKATDHIPQMIALVQTLEHKGFTYRTGDGIYFDTTKFPSYVDFARLDPGSIRAGERVEMGEKRSPTDFALWKISPRDTRRQMEWESPWGRGFPGWHLECSAMALAYLQQPVDIHCGGSDHVRIHHTNEIAQAEAATGKKFCRFWLHGEFLVVDKGKMAKSGDNFVTLDVLKKKDFPPLAYRLFCFSAHYRSPLAFSWEGVSGAAQGLVNLRKCFIADEGAGDRNALARKIEAALAPFYTAVYDDLNMPRAIAALWELGRSDALTQVERREAARRADEILGLDLLAVPATAPQHAETVSGTSGSGITISSSKDIPDAEKTEIVEKVLLRQKARKEKNFTLSDALRNEFAARGILVKDKPDGSTDVVVG